SHMSLTLRRPTSVVLEVALAHLDLPSFPPRRSSALAAEGRARHHLLRQARPVRPEAPDVPAGSRTANSREPYGWSVRPITISAPDRKSTRLNSSHVKISYAVCCLEKKRTKVTKTGFG